MTVEAPARIWYTSGGGVERSCRAGDVTTDRVRCRLRGETDILHTGTGQRAGAKVEYYDQPRQLVRWAVVAEGNDVSDTIGNFRPSVSVGDSAELAMTVDMAAIEAMAAITGDNNPLHLDEAFAAGTRFRGRIAHGLFCSGLVSAVLGTRLPGPGAVYLSQTMEFKRPVRPGDTMTARVTVKELDTSRRTLLLDTVCTNQDGEVVADGEARLLVDPHPFPT